MALSSCRLLAVGIHLEQVFSSKRCLVRRTSNVAVFLARWHGQPGDQVILRLTVGYHHSTWQLLVRHVNDTPRGSEPPRSFTDLDVAEA